MPFTRTLKDGSCRSQVCDEAYDSYYKACFPLKGDLMSLNILNMNHNLWKLCFDSLTEKANCSHDNDDLKKKFMTRESTDEIPFFKLAQNP